MSLIGERTNLLSEVAFWNEVARRRKAQLDSALRQRDEMLRALRELDAEIRMEAAAQPAPRYDDVYHEGVAALDTMARGDGDE